MKKFYVLFLVLVLVMAIGFGVACKYSDPQSGVEDKMNNQLWRGVMTGKVETYGPWALIEVKNPDDYNHPLEMMVVYNSGGEKPHIPWIMFPQKPRFFFLK